MLLQTYVTKLSIWRRCITRLDVPLIELYFGVKMSFCINLVTVTQLYRQDSDLLGCYYVSTFMYVCVCV
jgi:hypothetical protein